MKKFIYLFLSAALLLNVSLAHAVVSEFKDTQGHWARTYADYLHGECGVDGYKDGDGYLLYEFRPDNTITRAELVKMVLGCMGTMDYGTPKTFSDIHDSDWFKAAVDAASSLDWIEGYSDGTFRPNNNINRAEALKIIIASQFKDKDISGGSENFSDVNGETGSHPTFHLP